MFAKLITMQPDTTVSEREALMSGRHSETGRYDNKYGEKTVSWDNTQKQDESFKQYNVKDVETGDHYFSNTRTGAQGVALSDYRPGRDK